MVGSPACVDAMKLQIKIDEKEYQETSHENSNRVQMLYAFGVTYLCCFNKIKQVQTRKVSMSPLWYQLRYQSEIDRNSLWPTQLSWQVNPLQENFCNTGYFLWESCIFHQLPMSKYDDWLSLGFASRFAVIFWVDWWKIYILLFS